ncbi:uncharacterized protein [Phaseolus vulgaris]|uniref:uncharacterized protein n=1 Tax=Phaseolus vulgaris TaxID=3885 RepID=UPI0035CC514C
MFIMTHKPRSEETKKIISKLEDAVASSSKERDKTSDDVFSQVFGKERHGYVRTYGKGVVPSDLWGSKSQIEIQKLVDEVQKNAQVELQRIKEKMQEKMQEEMEAKLKQQVEAMKIDLLNNIKSAFTQLQSCIPGVMTQDLQEEIVVEKQSQATPRSKKRKTEKTNTKLAKGKSEDLTVGVVTLEKDLKTLQHPSTAIELFMEEFENNYKEINVDSENVERVHKKAFKAWKCMTNEEKEIYFNRAARLRGKLHFSTVEESGVQKKQIGKRERKPKLHFDGTN